MVVEEPRIGVFICHCGLNIGGVVNVKEVVEHARSLPNVVVAKDHLYMCSAGGLEMIKEAIREHRLNRVVVASCTPRTHEPLFRQICAEAGLNPYLFEMVNIREHCSWVHMREPEKATEKAKDLVRMAVAKARLLKPQEEISIPVRPSCLVIGGGISGMTASLSLAKQGFKVYLVEREEELGGLLRKLDRLYPGGKRASELLRELIDRVKNEENIEILTSTVVEDVRGFVGDFKVRLRRPGGLEEEIEVGTIIVATGAEELKPKGLYGYGELRNVVTQLELEEMLREGRLGRPKAVAFILCVGAREAEGPRTYCGRICCMTALKNAVRIKEEVPEAEVYVIYRDIQAYGIEYEELYTRARELGVRFIQYTPRKPPEVSEADGRLEISVFSPLLGLDVKLRCDLVVLSTPLVSREDAEELSKLLKVPLGPDGFFLEVHPKLRPVEFASDGIFLCGTAHGPKPIEECVAQARAAAAKAAILMGTGEVRVEAITARVNEAKCARCGICEALCPFGAPKLAGRAFQIVEALCKGCGVCAASCPELAIEMGHFEREQILAQIRACLEGEVMPERPEEFEPKIIMFACNWCSYAGADLAGVSRIQYPPNARIIRVMCSGRVDPVFVLEALRLGADGVLITGCHPGDCHYLEGNLRAEERVKELKAKLKAIGLEPERVRLEWISASEGEKVARVVRDFVDELKKLGPSPLKPRPPS